MPRRPTSTEPGRPRPATVFLGKPPLAHPPSVLDRRRFEIHSRHVREVAVVTGVTGVRRVEGVLVVTLPAGLRPRFLRSAVFYSLGPLIAVVLALARRRCPIICMSPHEGFGVVVLSRLLPRRWRPKIQVEVHGDWRTASRVYGSRARVVLAPVADRVCAWAIRRADRVRVVGPAMERLVKETGYDGPVDFFPTFSDYSAFLTTEAVPPPAAPIALFIGVFERVKGLDVLLDAWPTVVARVPEARLSILGDGPLGDSLRTRASRLGLDGSVDFAGSVSQQEVRDALDRSSCLVLPSRSEGLPRVILEAMARGRPVVASDVGGISEAVEDGRTGRLVPADDGRVLAEAVADVLAHPDRARAMGEEGRRRVLERQPAVEYDAGMARLAVWVQSTNS